MLLWSAKLQDENLKIIALFKNSNILYIIINFAA